MFSYLLNEELKEDHDRVKYIFNQYNKFDDKNILVFACSLLSLALENKNKWISIGNIQHEKDRFLETIAIQYSKSKYKGQYNLEYDKTNCKIKFSDYIK